MALTSSSRYKRLFFFLLLSITVLLYVSQLTHSGLWYDEAVEYFYSKFLFGEVPGGFGTANMYERITFTYQPPLYNVLMYFWLLLFDTETGFRVAGVIVTMLGAAGIYFALKETSGRTWAAFGTIAYLYIPAVMYYALECAEYNLMLAFLCWTIYFFVRVLKSKMSSTKDLVFFFIMASLSAYSQYGAVFLLISMYMILFITCIREKRKLRTLLAATLCEGLLAVIPLVYFFLLPQMAHQGVSEVSHFPYFAHKVWIDIAASAVYAFQFKCNIVVAVVILAIMAFTSIVVLVSSKDGLPKLLLFTCALAFFIYYLAVACSFYGYNAWLEKNRGTVNIGGKYALFLAPVFVVSFVAELHSLAGFLSEKKKTFARGFAWLLAVGLFLCCVGSTTWLLKNEEKDNVRAISAAWYENDCGESVTLVHQWSDANFQFYLRHNKSYSFDLQSNIITADKWIREADFREMEAGLQKMGVFHLKDFYYIGPENGSFQESFQIFSEVVTSKGYTIRPMESGQTSLVHVFLN